MGKLGKYVCDGQMSIFDFINKKKVKLVRKNEYENWRCNNCGTECPNRVIYGNWPYQGVRITKKCPGCNQEIDIPLDLQKIADRSNNYCTDSISRCNRTEIWEKAIGDCPQSCCYRCEKDCEAKKELICRYTYNVCSFSGHTCNKQNLWEVADTLDEIQCPHVCCRQCNTRLCGARCNGSEEPKTPKGTPPIHRYLRYGPHTLIQEVREETKDWLDRNGVPEWVEWSKSSLPCANCTWWDGTNCCSGGHTNHYEYGYLICDGFYHSIVERKPSTVGDSFPRGIKQDPHVYPLDIKGICDDAYCPQCGYIFTTWGQDNEIDFERCPECHVKVDWTLWHRINDEEV